MPAFTVGQTLVNPETDLVDGTKYVVQNQSTVYANFAVGTAAFTVAPDDALILGPIAKNNPGSNVPSHLEYTYTASTDHVRIWAQHNDQAKIVFHALG